MTNFFVLVYALIIVESGGNDLAHKGDCLGCLQIRPVVVQDVNEIYASHYQLRDRLDRLKSIEICRMYLEYYCTAERLGRPVTWEDAAKIWNAGPEGRRKGRARTYWKKVKVVLSQQEEERLLAMEN